MKTITASSIFLGLLSGSSIVDAYIPNEYQYLKQRSTSGCSKNNLYRALERLQRESRFCEALLQANPTVSIPSSLTATPLASFTTACNCILATAVPSTTSSTTTTTTTSRTTTTTSATTTSHTTTAGGCETETVTETEAATTVTITETKDAPPPATVTRTVTETAEPTTCSPNEPTGQPDAYFNGFESDPTFFKASVRTADNEFVGIGPYENAGQAHSGNWFYRVAFYRQSRGYYIGRFGSTNPVPVQANSQYRATFWSRQFGMDGRDGVCEVISYIDESGNHGIEGPGTAQGGFGITQQTVRPPSGNAWTKTEWTFNTGRYSSAVFAFFIDCSCPTSGECPEGDIYIGIDDFKIERV